MPLLRKPALLEEVERGLESSGWSLLRLSPRGQHPARYRVSKADIHIPVSVYIWNVSHGGGHRNAAEYRIQVTGLNPNQFILEQDGKTLILGFWAEVGVFAAFDYQCHDGQLGGSPSLQIGADALMHAGRHGFAVHEKGNRELAIAFRPDFLGNYVEHCEVLHQMAQQPQALRQMLQLAADPVAFDDLGMDVDVHETRRRVLSQTYKTLRATDFRDRVLKAYSHRCAMCGLQLDLLDGAHILPVSEPGSTDDTSNGIALCTLHHRAYDRRLVTFDPSYRIHLNDALLGKLVEDGQGGKLAEFATSLREGIHVPIDAPDRPNLKLVRVANRLRGWDL